MQLVLDATNKLIYLQTNVSELFLVLLDFKASIICLIFGLSLIKYHMNIRYYYGDRVET